MRDELDARLWNTHHEAFSSGLAAAGRTVSRKMSRLNRVIPVPLKLALGTLAASLAAITAPPPVFAEQARTASVEIAYSDLNLASRSGRQTLAARIDHAARQLCQPAATGALKERAERRACYREAIAGAHAQVDIAVAATVARSRPAIAAAR